MLILGAIVGAAVFQLIKRGRSSTSRAQPPVVIPPDALHELRQQMPEAAEQFEAPSPVSVHDVPAELGSAQTAAIESATSVAAATAVARHFVHHSHTAEIIAALTRWKPRRRQRGVDLTESEYEESLHRFLKQQQLSSTVRAKPRVYWGSEEAPGGRAAIPDFVFRESVLVELKADLTRSDQADRALGQMLRYLLAWKRTGSAVLAICGDVAPHNRFLVRLYVEQWRRDLGLPVTVFFKRVDESRPESPDG